MNTLEQRITVFAGKLADAAPPAPEFERLADARRAGDAHAGRRPLLAVAAVVLIVLGLVAVGQVRQPEERSATPSFEPGPSIVGMPFAVVPTALPDGWRFVDVLDSGESATSGPWSSYLFRDPATGAAIYVQTLPRPDDPDPGPFRDLRESFEATGSVTYDVDGSPVWMRVAGIDTDVAVLLAEALVLDDVGPDRAPRLPPDSGFEVESSRSITEASTASGSVAQLRLRTPNGTVDIVLDARDPDNPAWNHYGVPRTVDDRTVYVSPYSVTGEPIDGAVTAAVQVSNPVDLDGAAALFASLERAPLEAWDEIEDRIAADVSEAPVVDRIEIRDLVVTRHRGESLTAICASWQGTTRCRSNDSPLWGIGSTERADLIVRGLWVIAGSIDSDELTEFVVSPPDAVVGEHRAGDGSTFFVYAVPTVDEVRIDFDSDGLSGGFVFDRPPAR